MGDSRYTDTGHRGEDPRHGFGDDQGTRVGRPDGASEAPRDANPDRYAGNPSTNDDAVPDGLEGAIIDGEGDEGDGQRRIQDASRGDVNPDREAANERPTYDL